MKKIGLIGGVTWTSTIDYYRIINELSNQKSHGHHTAEVIIYSVDFHEVLIRMQEAKWTEIEQMFIEKAIGLKKAGADFFAIGSNTLSKVGLQVSKESGLPIVGMVESVAEAILKKGFKKVGFMGTLLPWTTPFIVKD